MLGLPKATELRKQLPKNTIYSKFNMNNATKDKFDADIKRIVIVNEISPSTTTIAKGENVDAIFVMIVHLKQENYNENNIKLISRLINQNMVFILEYEGNARLVLFHTKLIHTEWIPIDDLTIGLKGLNLDSVWFNIIVQVSGIIIVEGNSLEEQLQINEKQQRLHKQIAKLEKQAWSERQPKRKFELVQEINIVKKELEEM